MRGLSFLLVFVPAFSVVGCLQPISVTDGEPRMISDAAHTKASKSTSIFLPLMVESPACAGEFDPSLDPVAQITELLEDGSTRPVVATFATTYGSNCELVRVVPEEEHYIVNWHCEEYDLDPTVTYRITVSVD